MRAARTIWDTRIQCVCGLIVARETAETEVFLCANFGQVSLDPPRIIVNPNRLYPIEGIIRRQRRFSLSVLAPDHRRAVLRLIGLRRRQPGKADLAGLTLRYDERQLPFLADAIRTLFCEVETILETGDHTVMIARVATTRENPARIGQIPLLYRDVAGAQAGSGLRRGARRLLVRTGLPEVARRLWERFRPPPPPNLPEATYREGGLTEPEIDAVLRYGLVDRGRVLSAPVPLPVLRRPVGVCVVGTHWGMTHCQAARQANPRARLFVCGRDPDRTARLARKVGAEGYFIGLQSAIADARVQAVVLAIPHHLHASAAKTVLEAGKDVLVEKPIAISLTDADQMIGVARRAGKILMVAENMHFRTSVRLVAERISAGDAGEPLHLLVHAGTVRRPTEWAAEKEKLGGGTFMDIGIHYVRAMRLLMGEPDEVTAFRPMQINTQMTGEDGLQVIYGSRFGWQSHFLTTWSSVLGKLPDIILAGDKGTFHLWPMSGYFDFYPVAPRALMRLLEYVRPYSLQARLMRPELQRIRIRFAGPDDGYAHQMREFLTAVSEGRPPITPPEDGRRDLEIVLKSYQSMEGNTRVAIPPPSSDAIESRPAYGDADPPPDEASR